MTFKSEPIFFFFKWEKIIWPDSMKHEALKVLCYEKKALCSSCKTCLLFIIYKVSNALSSVTQPLHRTSSDLVSVTTPCIPYYCSTCTAFSFCKDTNQPSFSRLGHCVQMFYTVWHKTPPTHTLLMGDLSNHAGSYGPISVVELWPILYHTCQIFLNVTFFFFLLICWAWD